MPLFPPEELLPEVTVPLEEPLLPEAIAPPEEPLLLDATVPLEEPLLLDATVPLDEPLLLDAIVPPEEPLIAKPPEEPEVTTPGPAEPASALSRGKDTADDPEHAALSCTAAARNATTPAAFAPLEYG